VTPQAGPFRIFSLLLNFARLCAKAILFSNATAAAGVDVGVRNYFGELFRRFIDVMTSLIAVTTSSGSVSELARGSKEDSDTLVLLVLLENGQLNEWQDITN
jgi:hypothetical protein